MRRTRRLVALAAVLAALGTAPATAAAGHPAGHPGTAARAGGLPGSPSAPSGTAVRHDASRVAGSGASRVTRAGHGNDHVQDQDGVRGGEGAGRVRTRGADPADPFVVVASAAAGAGALVALVLSVARALRRRRG
ncbi:MULTISPECIES: hypothetical protein [unclassified Streptomyces]|uniref:hypothetical protein n=1 Tax=unclassified Streptomyces TaxID=2593676 RepID=UPI0033AB5205